MKTIQSYILALVAVITCGILGGCSDFTPEGLPEIPELNKVSNLKADTNGFNIDLSWTLPQSNEITAVKLLINGNNATAITLESQATSYTVVGQPMEQENIYTVKVVYGDYMSEGVSVTAAVPFVELPNATDLKADVKGRTVTLSWLLPQTTGITGVRVVRNGDTDAAVMLPADATSYELKGQPMDEELTYSVQLMFENYYASEGVSIKTTVPYITPKMGFVLLASSAAELPDDDERAAASWFIGQENSQFIQPSEIAELDADICPVLWIMVDRIGLEFGWQNLPSQLVADDVIQALRQYSANGGSLYLSNMATQLTVPLGMVPDNMAPTIFGNGAGGSGDDVWVINPYLGWDFRDGSDQGFYDRTAHAIYKGLTLEDPNNYGYENLPLIGPGQREDHNCMWDCNIYGRGNQPDVIKNFEVTTNSLVLATWGHVRDHCVAGLVEFYANAEHGRCIANGFAAYEWNQNSGTNPYQHNVEQLTSNILNYLK